MGVAAPVDLLSLYRTKTTAIEILDVPELGFLVVEGEGAPGGPAFTEALQALFSVSYGAHFLLKKATGQAPRVMPLEALWWVDDPQQQDLLTAIALGLASPADADPNQMRWQAMIVQPDPIDAAIVDRVKAEVRLKKNPAALDRLLFVRWAEGRCAQVLHVGPYAAEGPSLARLHQGIAAAGYRPRGRHHEIYLGDPRRSAPEKLRTLLRHPIERVPTSR